MILNTFSSDVQDKERPTPVWGKEGDASKGLGSHKQEARLSTIPKAKTEEDAAVGKNQIDCKRIAKREPEKNSTFF